MPVVFLTPNLKKLEWHDKIETKSLKKFLLGKDMESYCNLKFHTSKD